MGEEIKKKRTRVGGNSAPKIETRGREHKPLIARVKPPTEDAAQFSQTPSEDAVMQAVNILRTAGINITPKDVTNAHRINTAGISYKPRKEDNPKTRRLKKKVLVALEMALGVVAPAIKMVNVSRSQYDKWVQEDPEFAQYVYDLRETATDFTETQMLQKIRSGDSGMIKFYMVTKGKDRGYSMGVGAIGNNPNDVPQIRLTKRYVDPQADAQDAQIAE